MRDSTVLRRIRRVAICALSVGALAGALVAAGQDDLESAAQLESSGSLAQARLIYERLLPDLRKASSARDLAVALQHLGEVDLAQGRYQDASKHSSECAGIFQRLGKATEEVNCWSIDGRAQASSGNFAAALEAYQRALRIARARDLGEAEVALLNNTGNVYYFLGRYGDSARDYGEAEKALTLHAAENWFTRRRVVTVANMATLYQRVGQNTKALDLYLQLRATLQSLRPSEKAQMLVNMGTLYRRLGDPVKALEVYRTAEHSLGPAGDPATEISVAKNMGIALGFDLRDLLGALRMFGRALELARSSGNRRETAQAMLYLAETQFRNKNWREAELWFRQASALARELDLPEDEWKSLYGLGRTAALRGDNDTALQFYLDAIRMIESIRAGAAAPAMRTSFLADKRDVYDSAIRMLLDRPQPPVRKIFQLIEQAKARSFQDRVPDLPAGADLDRISAALAPGSMLLDYWMSESQLAVVWITRSGSGIARGASISNEELDELGLELAKGTGEKWRQLASSMSRKLLPFSLAGSTDLIIVPDGPLQLLPFEVLSLPNSGDRRILLENCQISYLPAAALSLQNTRTGSADWLAPWRPVFAGFADPRPASTGQNIFPFDWTILSHSAGEVHTAAAALGGRAQLHTGPDDLKVYLTDQAAEKIPVIHLATHAIADADEAERSRILFSPSPKGPPSQYLFAREIYKMNLRAVRLAVLSACDTERGTSIRGEGIQSFSRAFLAAGASSTITTLWRVGDHSSAEFCKRFYSHLGNSETVSRALREAKLDFYRSKGTARHPRYWSVFMLNGNPDTRMPRNIPWAALAAPVAAVVPPLLIWIAGKRRKPRRSLPD